MAPQVTSITNVGQIKDHSSNDSDKAEFWQGIRTTDKIKLLTVLQP